LGETTVRDEGWALACGGIKRNEKKTIGNKNQNFGAPIHFWAIFSPNLRKDFQEILRVWKIVREGKRGLPPKKEMEIPSPPFAP
jgi:hypothetical protein